MKRKADHHWKQRHINRDKYCDAHHHKLSQAIWIFRRRYRGPKTLNECEGCVTQIDFCAGELMRPDYFEQRRKSMGICTGAPSLCSHLRLHDIQICQKTDDLILLEQIVGTAFHHVS